MLFAENKKNRKSWHVQKFFSCMLDELWIYILPYYTHSEFGLKYLYTLCIGFREFGKYFIEGIWRRGTLCWIEKCVTLACYSYNSLNSGDESACLRCCLTIWHIGHNVKWWGVLSGSVTVAKSPFLIFHVISIFICFKVNSHPCQLGNEIGQVCWCLRSFFFDKVVHL